MEERSISEMRERYLSKLLEIEVYPVKSGTDVILRKNIEEVTVKNEDGPGTYKVWDCDEVQFRYPGTITPQEIEEDFETWWNYTPEPQKPTEPEDPGEEEPGEDTAELAKKVSDIEAELNTLKGAIERGLTL